MNFIPERTSDFPVIARAQFFNRFLSDEGPMLETLDYTIRIGSTPTFLYFHLYLYSAHAGHYVYFNFSNGLAGATQSKHTV